MKGEVSMSEEYLRTPVDTFLATTTIKPQDCELYREPAQERRQRCRKLVEAAKKNKKLSP